MTQIPLQFRNASSRQSYKMSDKNKPEAFVQETVHSIIMINSVITIAVITITVITITVITITAITITVITIT